MVPEEYLQKNQDQSLNQLKDLLRIPSVSAQSKFKNDMKRCGEWVENYFKDLGLDTSIHETPGHPIIMAKYKCSPDVPTALIYGHYDVQPPDPLDLWDSPPFEPEEKDGYIYARGASDDKGQMMTHFKATEAFLRTEGSVPLNLIFLIEGEEEAMESHLDEFISSNREILKADIAVVSDGAMFGIDLPAITYGLRGISFAEVKITGPSQDLHSGVFGGAVANPVNILCRMIGKLHDPYGRILIEGFYDDVYTPTARELDQIRDLPFNPVEFLESTGSPKLFGERKYSPLEQRWLRPTLDCNGIQGGYQGEGAKTIIPSWASVKISMRLVPDMDPADICEKTERYLKKICPDSVCMEIKTSGESKPVQMPIDSPWLQAAERAIQSGFDRKPYFIKEGGSIPIVETFKSALGIDTLLIGFGQNDDNLHSPNERFRIRDYFRGCITAVELFRQLSKVKA